MRSVAFPVLWAAHFLLYGCNSTTPMNAFRGAVVREGVSYSASVQGDANPIEVLVRLRNLDNEIKEIIFLGNCRIALILHAIEDVDGKPVWDGREGRGCFDMASPMLLKPQNEQQLSDFIQVDARDGAGRPLRPGRYHATVWVYANRGFAVEAGNINVR